MYKEDGWNLRPVRTLWKREKSFAPVGTSNPIPGSFNEQLNSIQTEGCGEYSSLKIM
jgi:hypothetical protein